MKLIDIMKLRRSRYQLTPSSPISDTQLKELLEEAITYTPSAFHSQSSRTILLLGDEHLKLWDIVKETLKEIVPPKAFVNTEAKLNTFAAGYGTILYFEDQDVVSSLQKDFPTYADNFPIWSNQSSGMLQYVVWTMLAEAGLGASLQHYNPLIDEKVAKAFDVPTNWKLISQMPFGVATGEDAPLEYMPIDKRLKIRGNEK